jgi:NitT/TauT family transport system substrate-binding protein
MRADRTRRPFKVGAVAALVTCLVASGCASGVQGAPPVEKPTITVSMLPLPPVAPLMMAMERGYFRQEGLNIKLVPAVNAVAGLRNPAVDISFSDYISAFAAAESFPTRVIQEIDLAPKDVFPIVVPPDSKIREAKDLRGKRIAVNSRKNFPELMSRVALAVNNIDADRQRIKFVVVQFPDMGKAMQTRKVDAAWVGDPFRTIVEQQGARKVLATATGPTAELPTTMYAVRPGWAERHPRTVAAFKRAIVRAQSDAVKNPIVLAQTVTKMTPVAKNVVPITPPPTFVTSGNTNLIRLKRVADLMYKFKFVRNPLDVRTLVPGPQGATG